MGGAGRLERSMQEATNPTEGLLEADVPVRDNLVVMEHLVTPGHFAATAKRSGSKGRGRGRSW